MREGQIDFDGLREIADTFEAIHEYCVRTGSKITKDLIDAFLHTMDLDGNGVLDQDEIIGVLSKKKEIGSASMAASWSLSFDFHLGFDYSQCLYFISCSVN